MSKDTQIDRESVIATWLESYEAQFVGASDDDLFTDDELEQLRSPQIEALVEQYAEHLDEQDNTELFGDDSWQKMRDAQIDEMVEIERIRLDRLTDKQLLAALPGVSTVNPSSRNKKGPEFKYIHVIPKLIPEGFVLAHKHVRPAHPIGMNGFRAFLVSVEDSGRFEVCRCKWSGQKHYRRKWS